MKNIFIIVSLLLSLNIFAKEIPELKDIFTSDEISKLKNGEIITRMFLKNNPDKANTHLQIKIPKTTFTPEDYTKYEMIVDEKAFIPYKLTPESKLSIYNVFSGFSKLKGMEYYSRRIAKTQELILNCYKIESLNNQKKVNDAVYKEIKPKLENYFFQEDNKFGKHIFKSEIFSEGDSFVMINTLMDAIVPISGKGDYKFITFFIYDQASEGYFYYTINIMKIRLGLELITSKTNATLFSNRLRASTIHFAKMISLNWSDKINPWNEKLLNEGKYRTY